MSDLKTEPVYDGGLGRMVQQIVNRPKRFEPHELQFETGDVRSHSALYATLPGYRAPVGFIWHGQTLVDHTEILYIWVHEFFRRQGIATAMLKELRLYYPMETLCTAVANDLSKPWLLANDFKHEPSGWFQRVQKPI